MERAQCAKHSRLHEFWGLPLYGLEAGRCESFRLLVLRTDVSRNRASKCLFGDDGVCQLWEVELDREWPSDGYQWPARFGGVLPDAGPQSRRRSAIRGSG